MPRRQQSRSPTYTGRRNFSSVPSVPAPTPPPTAKTSQPGVFGHMAATAGGVAVGSAVGHAIGHTVAGMIGGGRQREAQPTPAGNTGKQYEEPIGPCAWEIKQFLDCASNNDDINVCQGFNEAIRMCKEKHKLL